MMCRRLIVNMNVLYRSYIATKLGAIATSSTFAFCWQYRYSIMFKCWNKDPKERPSFSALVNFISGFAEKTAGYLDVSNYNPFEANISTATTGEEHGEIQTKEEHDTNVGVPLDDLPVEMNVQSPSDNGSPHDDSPV